MDQLTNYTNNTWITDTDAREQTAREAETIPSGEGTKQEEFDVELTAGAVYDALHERLALARTRALMGERVLAHDLLRQAHADYEMYKDALQGFPLHALVHAFTVTMQTLCAEKMIEADGGVQSAAETPLAFAASEVLSAPADKGIERKTRSRKRATKAA